MYDLAVFGIRDLERFSLATRRLMRCPSLNDALHDVVHHLCAEVAAEGRPALVLARALYTRAPVKRAGVTAPRHDVLAWGRNEGTDVSSQHLLASTLAVVRAAGVDVDEVRDGPPAFDERPTVAAISAADSGAWPSVEAALEAHLVPRSVLVVRFGLPDGAQICLLLGLDVVLDEPTCRMFATLGGSLRASLIPLTYRVRLR